MSVWQEVLSSANRCRVMAELAKESAPLVKLRKATHQRASAVLVPIVDGDREPELLFSVRTRLLREHRGQVWYSVSG